MAKLHPTLARARLERLVRRRVSVTEQTNPTLGDRLLSPPMRRHPVPVFAVLAGLAVSGCGGSSSSGSSSSSTSSAKQIPRAEFVQKADAICTADKQQLKAAGPPPQFDPATATKAQLTGAASFFEALSKSISTDVGGVSALGEPSESAPKQAWRQLRASLESTTVPNIHKVASDARAGDVKAFHADFMKFTSQDPTQTKDGKIVGFRVCGNN